MDKSEARDMVAKAGGIVNEDTEHQPMMTLRQAVTIMLAVIIVVTLCIGVVL
jgi:hypothetical protein